MPSKKGPRKISSRPQEKQTWESIKGHQAFLDWLNGMNLTDVALRADMALRTVKDWHTHNKWRERRARLEALQNQPEHLTIPEADVDNPAEGGDEILSRVTSAEEILGEDYIRTSSIHKQLIDSLEAAVANVKTKNLSISEIRALASTVKDLQAAKHDPAGS